MSDSFLSRWARRKQSARAAERPETPVTASQGANLETAAEPPAAPEAALDASPVEVPGDAPPQGVSDDWLARLPSLDSLTPDSDLTLFLRQEVPAALRKAALRRMWSLDPAIRDFVSEAREYAYDWNTPGGVPGLGPLLPTDDVQAMLKRVVDGVPRPVERSIEEPDHERPFGESDGEAQPAPEATEAPDAIAVAPATEIAAASPPGSVEDTAPSPLTVEQAPAHHPRLRRHGGAMPS